MRRAQTLRLRFDWLTLEERNPPGDLLQTWLAGSSLDAGVAVPSIRRMEEPSDAVPVLPRKLPVIRLNDSPAKDLSSRPTVLSTTPLAIRFGTPLELPSALRVISPNVVASPVMKPAPSGVSFTAAPLLVHPQESVSSFAVTAPPAISPAAQSAQTDTDAKPGKSGSVELAYTRSEILIGYTGENAVSDLSAAMPEVAISEGSRVLLTHDGVSVVELKLAEGTEPKAAVETALKLNGVAWAEVNHVMAEGTGRDFTPNDTQYASQYHHTKTQTNLAWDIQTGSSSILAADCDDGVGINHPDLNNNIYTNSKEASGAAGVDDDGNGYIDDLHGWDVNQNDGNPLPSGSNSHGTHVSGIIAAQTDNGLGVAGVAGGGNGKGDGVRILPVRWDGEAGWSAADIVEAYTYATDRGAKLVNSSYNFDGFATDNSVITAFNYGYSKGVLFFNSAGNNGSLGAARGVLTQCLFVASLDSGDVKSGFSNYGDFVDISAHGSGILSTTTNTGGTGVNYEFYDGTSMSTPHALGAAALIWSQNPTWSREQVVARLLATADSVDAANPGLQGTLGAGRINPYRALTETNPAPKFGAVTGLPAGSGGNVSSFSIIANNRLDPASVVTGNFELRGDGPDGTFDTVDDVLIPITINAGAAYKIGTNALTFAPVTPGNLPPDRYRFTGFSGATKLRDPFGTALDGDGNGTGGDHFLRIFNTAPSIGGSSFEDFNSDGVRNSNDPILAGRTVYLDINNNGALDAGTGFKQSAPFPVSDLTTTKSDLAVSGLTGTVTDVNVTVDITHTYDEDIDLYLISPSGTRIELTTDNGGGGDNYTNTVFDDQAGISITVGTAPFTGSFRSEGLLSALNGENPNGTWTLEAYDDASTDTGTVNSWSVQINTAVPEPAATTGIAGDFAFFGLAAGSYTVRQVVPSGWSGTGSAGQNVNVTASSFTAVDLGSAKNNRFYGGVYFDYNSNGIRDGVDAGIPGRVLFDDLNGNGTLDGPTLTTVTNTTAMAIADNIVQTSSKTVSGLTGTIVDLDVTLNLTHTYNSDLDIFLVAPNGTRIELSTDNGGSSNNMVNLRFDDETAASVTTISGDNVTGSFKPEGLLSAVDGLSPNGVWGLEIGDDATDDTGTLTGWSLHFTAGAGAEASVTTDAFGNAVFDLAAGVHKIQSDAKAGQSFTAPASGAYSVTAAGAPLTNSQVGVRVGAAPLAAAFALPNNQRSRILSAEVTFSEAVTFFNDGTANNGFVFNVTPVGGGAAVPVIPSGVTWNGAMTKATLTFAAGAPDYRSLPEGKFSVTVLAANFRDADGNFPVSNSVFSNASYYRLAGDCESNGSANGTVDANDLAALGSFFGGTTANNPFDFDDNDTIDANDMGLFGNRFGATI